MTLKGDSNWKKNLGCLLIVKTSRVSIQWCNSFYKIPIHFFRYLSLSQVFFLKKKDIVFFYLLVLDLGSLGPSTVTFIALLYVVICGGDVDTVIVNEKLFPGKTTKKNNKFTYYIIKIARKGLVTLWVIGIK